MTSYLLLVQAAAVILTAVSWVPQMYRVLVSPDRSGVSPAAWLIGVVLSGVWCIWALREGMWAFLLSEGSFMCGSLLILALIRGWGRALLCTTAASVVAAGAVAVIPTSWFAAVGIVLAAAIRLSQLGRIVRGQTSAGVSGSVWLILIAANTLWAVVGVVQHQPALVIGAAVTLVASVAVWVACQLVPPAGAPPAT